MPALHEDLESVILQAKRRHLTEEKVLISVAPPGGKTKKVEVDGTTVARHFVIHRPFALDPTLRKRGWVVAHKRSGLRATPSLKTRRFAQRVAEELSKVDINWGASDATIRSWLKSMPKVRSEVMKIVGAQDEAHLTQVADEIRQERAAVAAQRVKQRKPRQQKKKEAEAEKAKARRRKKIALAVGAGAAGAGLGAAAIRHFRKKT